MPSSWVLCRVALVRIDVSEEHIASIMRVTRISSSETSVLTRTTSHTIPEYVISRSHCCKKLKCYITLTGWAL
jgi:hypothetical protein